MPRHRVDDPGKLLFLPRETACHIALGVIHTVLKINGLRVHGAGFALLLSNPTLMDSPLDCVASVVGTGSFEGKGADGPDHMICPCLVDFRGCESILPSSSPLFCDCILSDLDLPRGVFTSLGDLSELIPVILVSTCLRS